MGLHFSRLLVGVWHKATHKVGLTVVQLKVMFNTIEAYAPLSPEPSAP